MTGVSIGWSRARRLLGASGAALHRPAAGDRLAAARVLHLPVELERQHLPDRAGDRLPGDGADLVRRRQRQQRLLRRGADAGRQARRFLVLQVAIPAALPHVFVGLFMGLGASFAVLVVAEMLGVKAGLGWYLQWAQGWAAYANMYAALIVMALMCSGAITLLFRVARPPAGLAEGSRQMVALAHCRTRAYRPARRLTSTHVSHAFDIDGAVLAGARRRQLQRQARRVRRSARPVRLRQVDVAAAGRRPRAADGRHVARRRRARSRGRFPRASSCSRIRRCSRGARSGTTSRSGSRRRASCKAQRHRVDAALDLVGLSGFRNAYPHQLSGGMAQRVALARALVNDPKILVLDEPLGKLDSLTRLTMQTEILSLWQRTGFTALLVTHDVEEALFLANRVIVLQRPPGAHQGRYRGGPPLSAPSRRSLPRRPAAQHSGIARTGCDMVNVQAGSLRKPPAARCAAVADSLRTIAGVRIRCKGRSARSRRELSRSRISRNWQTRDCWR